MMKVYKGIVASLLAGLMFAGLSACEKEGPAEKAGKAIDEATSDAADSLEDVGDRMEDEIEEAKEEIETKMEQ
jgi:hypothetical protein